jgi:hypothetical protein
MNSRRLIGFVFGAAASGSFLTNETDYVCFGAWVLSFKDNKYYGCVATYDFDTPTTPALVCRPMGSFEPPLMSGDHVKTLQAPGGPYGGVGSEEILSVFSGRSISPPDKSNFVYQ